MQKKSLSLSFSLSHHCYNFVQYIQVRSQSYTDQSRGDNELHPGNDRRLIYIPLHMMYWDTLH